MFDGEKPDSARIFRPQVYWLNPDGIDDIPIFEDFFPVLASVKFSTQEASL